MEVHILWLIIAGILQFASIAIIVLLLVDRRALMNLIVKKNKKLKALTQEVGKQLSDKSRGQKSKSPLDRMPPQLREKLDKIEVPGSNDDWSAFEIIGDDYEQ